MGRYTAKSFSFSKRLSYTADYPNICIEFMRALLRSRNKINRLMSELAEDVYDKRDGFGYEFSLIVGTGDDKFYGVLQVKSSIFEGENSLTRHEINMFNNCIDVMLQERFDLDDDVTPSHYPKNHNLIAVNDRLRTDVPCRICFHAENRIYARKYLNKETQFDIESGNISISGTHVDNTITVPSHMSSYETERRYGRNLLEDIGTDLINFNYNSGRLY